jgi:sirohydrochlorin ferrochelatase
VGDRTGLEMIRTLQDRAVSSGIDVFMECTITRLISGRQADELDEGPPVEIATYLLAGGEFLGAIRQSAAGISTVAEPIGVHPALVQLVLERYDEARR